MSREPKEIEKTTTKKPDLPICGIAMPISGFDGYPREHWVDVLTILEETIQSAGCNPFLVSDSEEIGIIQQRIVTNLYHNPLVICDVSGKNPNVMFELGMRLAFDRPVIIVKDDDTDYPFDTSPIEHLTYRKDLRILDTREFQRRLKLKIEASIAGTNQMSYLKSFGNLIAQSLEKRDLSKEDYIIESLASIKSQLSRLSIRDERNTAKNWGGEKSSGMSPVYMPSLGLWSDSIANSLLEMRANNPEKFREVFNSMTPAFQREVSSYLVKMGYDDQREGK